MLGKVIIENGVKKIQALTADTGTGAPVGSYLYMEKKSNPSGYLYCDGSTFDETKYPALYQYLGTNVLPDWRELGAKGAEKNTTLIFDSTETDPRTGQAGTQNHDVFAEGEFKDDQVQDHKHAMGVGRSPGSQYTDNACHVASSLEGAYLTEDIYYDPNVGKLPRKGTVTRGKSRAVFIYIKATSGLTENQQENVLNTINENLSYSTEEHKTGRKWIDGKDIYSITFHVTLNVNGLTNIDVSALNVEKVVKYEGTILRDSIHNQKVQYDINVYESQQYRTSCKYDDTNGGRILIETYFGDVQNPTTTGDITMLYTKTTD